MTDMETNLRSVLFLVIGILLLLSLIICIFIVSGESDLVETTGTVLSVKDSDTSKGQYSVNLEYEVDGKSYTYEYTTRKEVEADSSVKIFYHKKNKTSVQAFKTPKLIFVCPVIGLVICTIGLFELFKNNSNNHKAEYQTSVIGVVGDTRQLKIITDDVQAQPYEKTPEEIAEAQVKTIKKNLENIKPIEPITVDRVEQQGEVQTVQQQVQQVPVQSTTVQQSIASQPVEQPVATIPTIQPQKELSVPKAAVVQKAPVQPTVPTQEVRSVQQQAPVQQVEPTLPEQKVVETAPTIQSVNRDNSSQKEIVNKIQEAAKSNPSLGEDEIKSMIKDVLKEVISEVKVEKEPEKPVVQKRVLPNYFYISGTSLIYEEPGKEAKEISLKTIKSVVRTINSEGNVVKLVVSNDEVKCILTNMKNIDLEQVASLLHNKMSIIDENFNEVIEHKEY